MFQILPLFIAVVLLTGCGGITPPLATSADNKIDLLPEKDAKKEFKDSFIDVFLSNQFEVLRDRRMGIWKEILVDNNYVGAKAINSGNAVMFLYQAKRHFWQLERSDYIVVASVGSNAKIIILEVPPYYGSATGGMVKVNYPSKYVLVVTDSKACFASPIGKPVVSGDFWMFEYAKSASADPMNCSPTNDWALPLTSKVTELSVKSAVGINELRSSIVVENQSYDKIKRLASIMASAFPNLRSKY